VTETAEEEAPATRRRPPGHGPVIGWFRDPARAFATFGLVLGVAIAIVAPPFSGIDEPSHYARAARMAEGSVLPDQPPPGITTPGLDGVGQCLPRPVLHELALYVVENRFPGTPWTEESSKGRFPRCDDADERGFYANATYSWYSPLGYVPQAAAIKVGQILGLSVGTQLFLARLATLATYLALVTVAIRLYGSGWCWV
jgi:hypothetical protein